MKFVKRLVGSVVLCSSLFTFAGSLSASASGMEIQPRVEACPVYGAHQYNGQSSLYQDGTRTAINSVYRGTGSDGAPVFENCTETFGIMKYKKICACGDYKVTYSHDQMLKHSIKH